MRKQLVKIISVYLSLQYIPLAAAKAADTPSNPNVLLLEVERFDDLYLVQTRQSCAEGKMPAIKQDMDRDARLKGSTPLPDVDIYCGKVLAESQRRGHMADLYVNMALQEQGYRDFHSADQAQLLKNNESGRTLAAILHSAFAGDAAYTSITGQPRDLPCPLALDAGFAWATANTTATIPVDLTQADVEAAARECYTPGVAQITLHGVTYPAQKAGVIVGAWLARNGG